MAKGAGKGSAKCPLSTLDGTEKGVMKLRPYFEEVSLAIALKNGTTLSELLRLPVGNEAQQGELVADCHHLGLSREGAPLSVKHFCSILPAQVSVSIAMGDSGDEGDEQELSTLWNNVIALHLRALLACSSDCETLACSEQLALIQTFHRIFQMSSRWILPLAYTLHEDLWRLCQRVEGVQRNKGAGAINQNEEGARASSHQREESARAINRGLTICLTDRAPLGQSRRWGVYRVASLLLRVYFALGQLNLCTNVLRALGTAELPAAARYPMGQLVTWRYWLGRYYFVNGEWERALGELESAFAHCLPGSEQNKSLILHMLIPLRLHLQGVLPSPILLQRHGLAGSTGVPLHPTTVPPLHSTTIPPRPSTFYVSALGAIRRGDLKAYTRLLQIHERPLLRLGTFLLWEQLLSLVYRNLFRRIHRIVGGGSRLPLGALLVGIRLGSDNSVDLEQGPDETACHVANLIGRGLIRGYIHQERATLVLSQKDPFPKLATAE